MRGADGAAPSTSFVQRHEELRDAMVPIKILYTITWMEMGGSQTHLMQVFRLLDRTRFEPILYCLSGRGNLMDAVRDIGIPVHSGDLTGLKSARGVS